MKFWRRKRKTTHDEPVRARQRPNPPVDEAKLRDILWQVNPELAAEVERGDERRRQREAERYRERNDVEVRQDRFDPKETRARAEAAGPLHAHEITSNDAAVIRMLAGAGFGDDATVVLPSGRAVTGSEMRKWVDEHPAGGDDCG